MAAPTFVGASAIGAAQGGVDLTSTLTLPGHQAGDIGIIYGWARAITATITVDNSWTQLTTWDDTDESDRHFIWWKRFTSGSESNPTVTRNNTTGDMYSMAAVYRGAETSGNPFEVVGTPAFSATDNYNLPGITTLTAESLVVVCVGMGDNNATGVTVTATDPAAFTEHYLESAVGGDGCVSICEAARTTAGATGNVNVTYGVAFAGTVNSSGVVLALKPPGSTDRRAVVSWAELEVPNAPRRAVVSWAELEVPNAPRRAQVSWAELEVPNAPRRAQVTWAELEVPDTTQRRAQVTWAEFEVPTAPRRAQVTWAEFEAPNAPRRAQVSWAELEVPTAPRRAQVSWAELEVPTAPRRALVTWAELEVPDATCGTTYYVSTTGSNANPGTEAQPWLTIQHAVDNVIEGDTIIVEDGLYQTSSGTLVQIFETAGTSTCPITLKARNPRGAHLYGNNTAETAIRVNSGSSWWIIEGFEISGFARNGSAAGITIYGTGISNITIRGNYIHEIGKTCTDTSNGQNGIFVGADTGSTTDVLIEKNEIHDIGRFEPDEGGCTTLTTTRYQNHDHGIYVAEADDVTVINNLIYDCARGWCIQRFNTGGHNTQNLLILNNTFAFENPYRDGHIIVATSTTGLRIENNISYDPRVAFVSITGGTHTSATLKNNLTFGGTVSTGSTTGFTVSGNQNNTDPLFVDDSFATPDFHLQSGSPAIDAGLTLSEVTDDYEGTARPVNSVYDIGAFETAGSTDRRAQITWAELEIPTAPRRAQITWAELEVPNGARRAQITWAELEVPNAPSPDRRAIITWAELEVPKRRGRGGFKRILYDPEGAQREIDDRPDWSPDDVVVEAAPLPEPGPLPEPRITEPTKPVRLPKKPEPTQRQIHAAIEIVGVDDDDEIDFIINVVLDLD